MTQDELIKIEKKLDILIKVIAGSTLESKKFEEKVIFLSNAGCSDNYIADFLNVKSVTVRSAKSKLKNKNK